MWIGIDDTDSPAGMCTTYIGAVLVRQLEHAGIRVVDTRLVRLNPNVIHKTRGNAAVCIEAVGDLEAAFELVAACVEELAEFDDPQTNPGVAVHCFLSTSASSNEEVSEQLGPHCCTPF